jgi:hypothetical protein
MVLASPPPRMPRCSALSRSFLSGQGLRSGVIWQLSGSKDRHDQPNHSVHALRGTPLCLESDQVGYAYGQVCNPADWQYWEL